MEKIAAMYTTDCIYPIAVRISRSYFLFRPGRTLSCLGVSGQIPEGNSLRNLSCVCAKCFVVIENKYDCQTGLYTKNRIKVRNLCQLTSKNRIAIILTEMFCYVNNVTEMVGRDFVKAVFCAECQTEISTDEVALNQRLLGMQVGSFFCITCFARKLHTTPEHLQKLIVRFKTMGCAYFTRLMEDSSDEETNDNV